MKHEYPYRQLVEIASWQVVTELVRRHPSEFEVIEAHPSGGQSDCLALCGPEGNINVVFNRPGSFAVFKRFDRKSESRGIPEVWNRILAEQESLPKLIEEFERQSGLSSPSKLPSTNRKVLSFRVMSMFLRTTAFSLDVREWRNGFLDTSGFGGGIQGTWFGEYPQLHERLREKLVTDFQDQSHYRLWFLIDEKWGAKSTLACVETTGWVHFKDGTSMDLMKEFKKAGRKIMPVAMKALGQFGPES